jgi:isochorismate synthase
LAKADKALENELPFVVYRYPNDSLLRGIFQGNADVNTIDNFNGKGFVIAPFDSEGDKILISGEYFEKAFTRSSNKLIEGEIELSDEGKESYLRKVQTAIDEIRTGALKKIVLSRYIKTKTKKKPSEIIESLLSMYANAFCYWWYHPKVGMWLGATPEQLLKYQKGTLLTTSLAGTLPVVENRQPNWTSKEREEQQMVTDYIKQSLNGKARNITISEVSSHQAGKLWHLKSKIEASLNSFAALKGVLDSLHPTPAVCGLPKKKSLNFILQHEEYDREYYTGYLGPINVDENQSANLFVNLRCLKYDQGQAWVYVGGGITEASNPEEEWKETQFKSGTILEVL